MKANRAFLRNIVVFLSLWLFVFEAQASERLYFCHVAAGGNWDTRIGLCSTRYDGNPDGMLTAYDRTGKALSNAVQVALPGYGARVLSVNEAFSKPAEIAYMVYESENPGAAGFAEYIHQGTLTASVAAVGRIEDAALHFPGIFSDEGQATGFALLNTSGENRDVSVKFDSGDSVAVSMAPGEHRSFTLQTFLDKTPPQGPTSAIIENSEGMIGVQIFSLEGGLGGLVLKGETANRICFPHVSLSNDSEAATGVAVFNPSSKRCEATLVPYDAEGKILVPKSILLKPGERYFAFADEMDLSSETAWLMAEASVPVAGFEIVRKSGGKAIAALECAAYGSESGSLPVAQSTAARIILVNTGESGTSVYLDAYDQDGAFLDDASMYLNEKSKLDVSLEELFPDSASRVSLIAYDSWGEIAGFVLDAPANSDWKALPAMGGRMADDLLEPWDFVHQRWDENYRLDNLAYETSNLASVMSVRYPVVRNGYRIRDEFATNLLDEIAAEGFHITDSTFGNDTWYHAVSSSDPPVEQTYVELSRFSESYFWMQRMAGFFLTNLEYGQGQWAAVLSQKTGYRNQVFVTSSDFPAEAIREKRKEDYFITELCRGEDQWVAVLSKGPAYSDQSWSITEDFPKNYINSQWSKGYYISELVHGDGNWVAVTSKGAPARPQACFFNGIETQTCSVEEQNAVLYEFMKDRYYWNDHVPEADYAGYDSMEDFLDALLYDELDQWSYVTTKESNEAYYEEGKYVGYGFGWKYDGNHDVRASFVYADSPAARAGMRRGDKFLALNGTSIEEVEEKDSWSEMLGPDEIGVSCHFKMETGDGGILEYKMVKAVVKMNTVLHADVLDVSGKRLGYLVFNKFLEPSRQELDEAFQRFKQKGVEELILDLRYNGGGRIDVSVYLASLIGGKYVEDGVYFKYKHNDNYASWDRERTFEQPDNALNLSRVFVITTGSTCSASEAVINGLRPFVEVITIGGTTCGKPAGMYAYTICDKSVSAIQFKDFNADDEGDYFDGFQPTCQATDNLSKELGDMEEDSLKTAIFRLENGRCPVEAATLSAGGPDRMEHDGTVVELTGFAKEIGAF